MKPSTGFEDGSTLVNGNLEKKGFGMGIATGMYNSVLLRLPKGAADPQLVRIWQRGGGSDNAGCCFSRLKDIEVVYNNTCTGASAVAAYPSQPSNFAELNLGPERFLWIAGEWLPSICPANQPCGTVPTTRRQNVSCVGDKGTHASSDAECSESGDRPTANHSCPRAPCCIEFGQTMEIRYVSPGGDDSRSGCDPSQPLRSLASCIASSSQPTLAVTCRLLPGSYREEVLVQGQDDLTIELAPESEWPAGSSASAALMDGTETITFESEALVDANGPFLSKHCSHRGVAALHEGENAHTRTLAERRGMERRGLVAEQGLGISGSRHFLRSQRGCGHCQPSAGRGGTSEPRDHRCFV